VAGGFLNELPLGPRARVHWEGCLPKTQMVRELVSTTQQSRISCCAHYRPKTRAVGDYCSQLNQLLHYLSVQITDWIVTIFTSLEPGRGDVELFLAAPKNLPSRVIQRKGFHPLPNLSEAASKLFKVGPLSRDLSEDLLSPGISGVT
jgi:hypothetical protein